MAIESFGHKALRGLSIISTVIHPKDLEPETIQILANTLAGLYDEELKCAFSTSLGNKDLILDPAVDMAVERLKRVIRNFFQDVFTQAEKEDEKKKQELLDKMKESHKPHAMGTVAEIAAKYNISKSEVRRRKAEGTIELLQFSVDN